MVSPVERILDRGAARVTSINQTTRDEITAILTDAVEQGIDLRDVATALEVGSDLTSLIGRTGGVIGDLSYRSEMIARTELMNAYNSAALYSYSDAGLTMVQAIDGDKDDECASRNGKEYTILEAHDIEDHPNGTLDWVPVLEPAMRARQSVALQSIGTSVPGYVPPRPIRATRPTGATPETVVRAERDIIAKHGDVTGFKFKEYGQTFAADGTPLTDVITGATGSVGFGDLPLSRLRGSITTHLHPMDQAFAASGPSLSAGDVKIALDHQLKVIRAFYADGRYMELRNVSYAYNGARFDALFKSEWNAAKTKLKRLTAEAMKSPDAMAAYKEFSASWDAQYVEILRKSVSKLEGLELTTGSVL